MVRAVYDVGGGSGFASNDFLTLFRARFEEHFQPIPSGVFPWAIISCSCCMPAVMSSAIRRGLIFVFIVASSLHHRQPDRTKRRNDPSVVWPQP
jgi:hypothetical protein